jgi:diguanylate cyclase (GGDEF)-like protein
VPARRELTGPGKSDNIVFKKTRRDINMWWRGSMSGLSLKRRIWIAIALVSLIPFITFLYFSFGYHISFWATIVLIVINVLGWWVVFEVFSSIIRIDSHSKSALRNIGERLPSLPDEVQDLEAIISLLSDKVKRGFDQLSDFAQKTQELNKETTRKVLLLSAILQANDLFSKNTPAEEVIKFLTNQLKQLLEAEVSFCILRKRDSGKLNAIASLGLEASKAESFIGLIEKGLPALVRTILIDKKSRDSHYLAWAQHLGINNVMFVPVISKKQTVGIVGVGTNREVFSFAAEDIEVVHLFSQNVTLIWEHERLTSKVEELEIFDNLTDLYNRRTLIQRLDEEIQRTSVYQRPCGFITVEMANYDDYQKELGVIEAERMLKKIAKIFKYTLKNIDIAGRIDSATLGAILIESNKRQSQEVIENLQTALSEGCGPRAQLTYSAASTPIDGVTAQELIVSAKDQRNKAKQG